MQDWDKAKKIKERLEKELPEKKGKVVAIETDSGDYFIGENTLEAVDLAKQKHPDKKFICERLGHNALFSSGVYLQFKFN